jgi:chromate reductase, NAD(P)H dehydrogenase (quinone)
MAGDLSSYRFVRFALDLRRAIITRVLKSNLLEWLDFVCDSWWKLKIPASGAISMIQFRLLGLSGSLRRSSYSTAVLRGLRDLLAPRAALDILPLHGLPLYNEDDDDAEHGPESVRALRSAIEASDGVIMISPEYNHGMSGVLKNALDWVSRPHGLSVLRKKPVLTMTASPAFTGGARAQQQMNETLASIPAQPVLRPQIVIGGVHEKVQDGRLVDKAALGFMLSGVDDLLEAIRLARSCCSNGGASITTAARTEAAAVGEK